MNASDSSKIDHWVCGANPISDGTKPELLQTVIASGDERWSSPLASSADPQTGLEVACILGQDNVYEISQAKNKAPLIKKEKRVDPTASRKDVNGRFFSQILVDNLKAKESNPPRQSQSID